jgi:uncharacterized protein YciI
MMTLAQFETLLDKACSQLGKDIQDPQSQYRSPEAFEKRVFEVLKSVAQGERIEINPTFNPHAFPDIRANGFGVEVKTTNKDSWQSVGNSVFEGMRDPDVTQIYVVFGKMGGAPSVKWGRYEEKITHVRISHAPRFVLEMDDDKKKSLFKTMGVSYDEFYKLSAKQKMWHIRKYSRGRLRPGEMLWWLEDESGPGLPVKIKLYMSLPKWEKTRLRAEGALLCPQVVSGSREKGKYNDVAFFFLKYKNVFCPQTRDLFTAGSVVGKQRGGNRILTSLKAIEKEMVKAAHDLDESLFEEYWRKKVPPENRIKEWLKRADSYARGWKPSDELFKTG